MEIKKSENLIIMDELAYNNTFCIIDRTIYRLWGYSDTSKLNSTREHFPKTESKPSIKLNSKNGDCHCFGLGQLAFT